MADYVEYMRDLSDRSLAALLQGVESVYVTDLPDHPNVGDSAIALGEFAFLRRHSVRVVSAYSVGTLSPGIAGSDVPVLIHGGGNIGGLYPQYDEHRDRLHQILPIDRLVIQAPQTVDFVSESTKARFFQNLGSRSNFRIALRDGESANSMVGIAGSTMKAPDAFHSYGVVDCDEPTKTALVVSRTDGERTDSPSAPSVDWPTDHAALALTTRIRKHAAKVPLLPRVVNPTPDSWERVARTRFERGVRMIGEAEVIVTDRLHAMLMALQMRRRVIAVDNATRKLSRYAEAWFGPAQPELTFARTFDEALQRAR